ncbi:MAG: ferredoxin--nitrite reductase, partial [Acidobacteriota bacterium]
IEEIPLFAKQGWEAISEADRERLKWAGIFFRKQTPGHFMMRLRISNGITNAAQLRTIAELSDQYGKGFVDITTRQQLQLRWYKVDNIPAMWERLQAVGLTSLQTGMDNIRNVIGCPLAGLTTHELFDGSPAVQQFTEIFINNRAYTNLPRKFNVAITACLQNCIEAETQDIACTPAIKEIAGKEVKGFNVAIGGKIGSGGYRIATPLDLFVRPAEVAAICSHISLIFRDHGSRESRSKARLAFLIEDWGIKKFRQELQRRVGHSLMTAGRDMRINQKTDHIGIWPQKQQGLNYAGLVVPVGRITTRQLFEVARLAEVYGDGSTRLAIGQNIIIANIPDEKIEGFKKEPLLNELRYNPSEIMRGLVSCTGIDYCHLALIETKELARKTAWHLEQKLSINQPISIHWSGCPAGCGNHAVADIGLLGKNIRINGKVTDAVDVFVGGRAGPNARPPIKLLDSVPCDELPEVLERIVPYISHKENS